jgi:hypothetical protein
MRWRNRGTYGWIYSRTKFTGKRYEEDLWLSYDYYDSSTDLDRNMRVGLTSSWTESWKQILHDNKSTQSSTANWEPYKTNWNHKEIKFTVPYN